MKHQKSHQWIAYIYYKTSCSHEAIVNNNKLLVDNKLAAFHSNNSQDNFNTN